MNKSLSDVNDFHVIKEIGKGKKFLFENKKTKEKFTAKVLPKCKNFDTIKVFIDGVYIVPYLRFESIISYII